MPWAIFHKAFDFDYRPQQAACQHVKASAKPQQFPGALIAAAITAGAATGAATPSADEKRSLKPNRVKPNRARPAQEKDHDSGNIGKI